MPAESPTIDRVFHALADPSRLAMIDRLSLGPASVSELAAPLTMSLPAVTQHIKVLEQSGLVRSEKLGRVRTCSIEPDGFHKAESWISDRKTFWERQFDRLGEILAEADNPNPME
jgi:DNA-binding transcriptional ArsR family regulator